jgi:hypothetical protein
MVEVWKKSPSVEGLEGSRLGRIMVTPYFREMPYGGLRRYGGHPWYGNIARDVSRPRRTFRFRGKTYKVHRLICEAFHGPEPFENADVIHRNGDTLDNVESNVRWATRAEILAQLPMEAAMTDKIDVHNELAGKIVRSIFEPIYENGGSPQDILIITESVVLGVMLAIVKFGGDDFVLDTMVDGVKRRLSEERLRHLPPQGRG